MAVGPPVGTQTRHETEEGGVRSARMPTADALPTGKPRRIGPGGLRRLLMLIDGLAVAAGLGLVILTPLRDEPLGREAFAIVAAGTLVGLGLARMLKLYQARVSSVRDTEIRYLAFVSAAAATAGVVAAHRVSPLGAMISPVDGVVVGGAIFGLLITVRGAFDAWLRDARSRGHFCRRIAIVGTGSEAIDLYQVLLDHPEFGYRVVGAIGAEWDHEVDFAHWIGPADDLLAVLDRLECNGVLVADEGLDPEHRNGLVKELLDGGIHVHMSTGLQGFAYRRLRMVPIAHEPLFYLERSDRSRFQEVAKRLLDVCVSLLLLLIAAPLLGVLALAVRLQDGGPAFFRQDRVGRNGEYFTFLKLRTMVVNAEALKADLEAENQRSGPLFKATNDPRITKLGRFLRSSSLDELPQLINVLKGEMSLVGPRPALPDEVEHFDDELLERLTVPPGITGLWQVEARDNPTFRAYRRFDLFYVENWSIGLDLVILVLTAQQVVARAVGLLLKRRRTGMGAHLE